MNQTDSRISLELDDGITSHLAKTWGVSKEEAVRRAVEQANTTTRRTSKVGLLAYSLFFTGLFLIMLSVLCSEIWHLPVWVTAFVRDFGLLLSAVMAGTILHEKLLRDEMVRLIEEESEESASKTAKEVHRLFSEQPPRMTGIRLLNEVRRNFAGYYDWVNEQKPQELFFAGRSVLHRIDADVRSRTTSCAEDILFRRLKEGSKIKILFLDPRIEILQRLADEEGQPLEDMLGDIATSIGICQRLYNLLQRNYVSLRPESELSIRVYNRVPYFAFHKQDDQVILGFYFSSKGSSSAAYEIVDGETKQVFSDHFERIMSEAASSTLVGFDGARGRPRFDQALFSQLRNCLSQHLGPEQTDQLVTKKLVNASST